MRLLARSRRRLKTGNPVGVVALAAAVALCLVGCASTPEPGEDALARTEPTITADGSGTATVTAEVDEPVAAAVPPVEGRRVADVQAAFAARQASLRRLNSSRASQNPGKIVVSFVVAPTGQVVECRLVSSEFEDPAFNAAVFAEVWRLFLGERNVGEWAVTDYPIEFVAREAAQAPATSGSSPPNPPMDSAPASSSAAPAG